MISKLIISNNKLFASKLNFHRIQPKNFYNKAAFSSSSSSSNANSGNLNHNSDSNSNSNSDSILNSNQESQQGSINEEELEAILKKNDQYNPERHRMLADIVKETNLTYTTENHDEYFKTTAMYFRMEEEKALRKLYPGLVRLPKKHPGRLNLEQADAFFEKYRLDPVVNPPEALAEEFKLDVELVKKLLKIYQYPIHKK